MPPDAPRPALAALPTSEVVLRPSLVDALHQIAPKPRRSKVWYVLGIAVLGLLVWMVATPSVRALIVAKGRQLVSGQAAVPATEVPGAAAPPVSPAALPEPSASSVAVAPVVVIPVAATASGPAGAAGRNKRRPHP